MYKKDSVVLLDIPTVKDLICSFCFDHSEELFSNQDIFNEIKNIECHILFGLGYPSEKVIAGTIIAMQKNKILTRDYYLVNGTRVKLLSVTPFGKQWLIERRKEKIK